MKISYPRLLHTGVQIVQTLVTKWLVYLLTTKDLLRISLLPEGTPEQYIKSTISVTFLFVWHLSKKINLYSMPFVKWAENLFQIIECQGQKGNLQTVLMKLTQRSLPHTWTWMYSCGYHHLLLCFSGSSYLGCVPSDFFWQGRDRGKRLKGIGCNPCCLCSYSG